jgi:hypothetical protein
MFGDILSSAVSVWNAEKNRDANYEAQSRSQDFNERMSNTQYQRTVQDLNAAGLSPMLAYGGKPSAPTSSPVGSNSSVETPKFGETSKRLTETQLLNAQKDVHETQAQLNTSNAKKADAEAEMYKQETENKKQPFIGKNEAEIQELKDRAAQHGASANQLKALEAEIRQLINLKKPEEQFKADHPTYSKYASPVMDALNTIFKGIGAFRGNSATINTTTTYPDGSKSTKTTTRGR